jgi:hypothetical protein
MSRLDGKVELQTPNVKDGCRVRDSARTSKVDAPVFSLPKTLNIYAESTCNFEKVVVRKVERKFGFTSLRHRVYLLYKVRLIARHKAALGRYLTVFETTRE